MKRGLKLLWRIFLIFSIVLMVFIISSAVYHRYMLKKEAREYLPPGKLVEVNGHKLHIYGQGDGDPTLVFMAGGGTSCPTLDFKPLWMRLVDDYRIVVIEKAGYGWSDIAKVSRDIDTILEETRMTLELSGEKGRYVLVPHSMSGLEAVYWAQKYPEEVIGIVGLDPAIPETYEYLEIPPSVIQGLGYLAARTGIIRWIPSIVESSSVLQANDLSSEEKQMYKAILYKSTLTKNMLEEAKVVKANAKKVKATGVPKGTPMYFFISDGKEIGMENWREILTSYIEGLSFGKYMQFDSGHYIHHYEKDIIAEEMKIFINQIILNQNVI